MTEKRGPGRREVSCWRSGRSLKGQLTHARRLGAKAIVEWGPERSTLRRPGRHDEEVATAELAERLKQ